MKTALSLGGLSLVLALVLTSGCATTGPAMSDEELVQKQLGVWSQGLVEQNMEMFLSTISESFSAAQAPDKKALADFIQQAIDAGYLEGAEVSAQDAQYTMGEGVCSVYPLDLMSVAGNVAVELTFTKEDGQWLVTGMEVDGL